MFYWKHVKHGCAAFRTTMQGWHPNSVKINLSSTVHRHNTSPLPLLLRGRIHFTPRIHYCWSAVMYGDTSLNSSPLIGLWPECLCYDWLPLKASQHPHPRRQWFLKVCCCILNSTECCRKSNPTPSSALSPQIKNLLCFVCVCVGVRVGMCVHVCV